MTTFYGKQIWGGAKPSQIYTIQSFQSISLHTIPPSKFASTLTYYILWHILNIQWKQIVTDFWPK